MGKVCPCLLYSRVNTLHMAMSRRIVFLSTHYILSRRRAGFHWLAEAFRRRNWHVTFATVGFGPQSYIKRDFRCSLVPREERNRLVTKAEGLDSFVWYTPLFPANLKSRVLNWLSWPFFVLFKFFSFGPLEAALRKADVIVFESNSSVLLAHRIRRLNSHARLVYRVSDDLRVLNSHPMLLAAEKHALSAFDLVSVVTKTMEEGLPGSIWHSHGVEKVLFDNANVSPYRPGTRNALFIGTFDYDEAPVVTAARAFPDWTFHVLGPIPPGQALPNIIYHGEMRYEDTVAYVRHADIGLATRIDTPDVRIYSDSLKMLQYTYAGLPIIAPRSTFNRFGNVVVYEPGNEASVIAAMHSAIAMDRSRIPRDAILSWGDLADHIAGDR